MVLRTSRVGHSRQQRKQFSGRSRDEEMSSGQLHFSWKGHSELFWEQEIFLAQMKGVVAMVLRCKNLKGRKSGWNANIPTLLIWATTSCSPGFTNILLILKIFTIKNFFSCQTAENDKKTLSSLLKYTIFVFIYPHLSARQKV